MPRRKKTTTGNSEGGAAWELLQSTNEPAAYKQATAVALQRHQTLRQTEGKRDKLLTRLSATGQLKRHLTLRADQVKDLRYTHACMHVRTHTRTHTKHAHTKNAYARTLAHAHARSLMRTPIATHAHPHAYIRTPTPTRQGPHQERACSQDQRLPERCSSPGEMRDFAEASLSKESKAVSRDKYKTKLRTHRERKRSAR